MNNSIKKIFQKNKVSEVLNKPIYNAGPPSTIPSVKIISLRDHLSEFFKLVKQHWCWVLGLPLIIAVLTKIVLAPIIALLSMTLASSGTYPNLPSFIILFVGILASLAVIILATVLVSGFVKLLAEPNTAWSLVSLLRAGKTSVGKFWRVSFQYAMVLIMFIAVVTGFSISSYMAIAGDLMEMVLEGSLTSAQDFGIKEFLLIFQSGFENSFLFLIIIAIVLLATVYAVWYFISGVLAITVAITENRRGGESIKRSRELTRRHWWLTFGRLIVFKLMMLIPVVILLFLIGISAEFLGGQLASVIVSFSIWLTVILTLLFIWPLYQSFVSSRTQPSLVKTKENWFGIVIAGIVLGLIFCLQQTFYLLNTSVRDVLVVNDSALQFETKLVPESENALYVFFEGIDFSDGNENYIQEQMNWSNSWQGDYKEDMTLIGSYTNGKDWDEAKVESMLKSTAKLLYLFDEAVKLDKFQSPYTATCSVPMAKSVPYTGLRVATRHVALRSIMQARNGQGDLAMTNALKLLKFGKMVGDDYVVIANLVGLVMRDMGWQVINQNLSLANYSRQDLVALSNKIDSYADALYSFKDSFKCDYKVGNVFWMEIDDKMAENNLRYYYQAKMCQQARADSWTKMIAKADAKDPIERQRINNELEALDLTSDFSLASLYHKNLICDTLQTLVAVALSSTTDKALASNYLYIATKINIASLLYQKDYQKMPESLADLVPDYLDSMPIDPLDNQQVRYLKEQGIIYSVGMNAIDEQGQGDDIVVKLAK